jgi:tetratricopeptide (TPR) repeat protein
MFLALLLLSVVPYLNTLTGDFVYDDKQQILDNPYVHSYQYIGKSFGSTVWTFQGAQGVTNYYRPLMTFAYLLCYKLYGPLPFGFHLLSLVLNIAVVFLAFALTQRLFGDRLTALIAAGLFALHPIHTESVAWIAGITDLELSAFFLLTFLLYLRLGDRPTVSRASLAAIVGSYVLALMSKEQALMLPFLAAAYEHFYRPERQETPLKTKLSRYLPLFGVAIVYFCFRAFVLGGFAPSVSRPELTSATTILSAFALVGQYLWKLIWPLQLSAFYVFHPSQRIADAAVMAGLAGFLVCAALFFWLWRRERILSFSFLWMGIAIVPVLNARWLPASVFAERYLYLPSVGFCWLIGFIAAGMWRTASAPGNRGRSWARVAQQAVPLVLGVVAVLYGIRTVRRNRDWHSDEILYTKTLALQPDAQIIRTNLGALYFNSGNLAGAEREWLASLGPARPYASTLNNLGILRSRQMRYDEAIAYFHRAIAERPRYTSPHTNLAKTYAEMGRDREAEAEYQAAVALSPLSSDARNEFANFLMDRGRPVEAQEQFALSAQVDPSAEAEVNLGNFQASGGDADRARAAYTEAIKINPFDSRAHFGLAKLDEAAGNLQDALKGYQAGLETDPQNAQAREAVNRLGNQSGAARANTK